MHLEWNNFVLLSNKAKKAIQNGKKNNKIG